MSTEPDDQEGGGPIVAPRAQKLALRLMAGDLTARRAVRIIAIVTIFVAVAGGALIWVLDKKDFTSFGQGIWWSIQTVTTVGYGDVVPHNTWGRIIAGFVMLSGIALIAVATAAVTAALVESARKGRHDALLDEINAELKQINARLARIENGDYKPSDS